MSSQPRPRNLLLITTDQERWFDHDPVPLPAHDRLRSAGTSYDHFYAASIACSSARSVMYTGQHVTTTGVIDNVGLPGQPSMTTGLPTLGTILSGLGYLTAYKGKWHLSTEALPEGLGHLIGPRANGPLRDALVPYGFSDYNDVGDDLGGPYEGYEHDARIASDASGWIRRDATAANAAGRPWCLAVNFVNPHDIMFATRDPAAIDRARNSGSGYTGPPDDGLYATRWDLPDDPTWNEQVGDAGRPGAHLDFALANQIFTGTPAVDDEQRRELRDYYLNCLRDVDRHVMTVLDSLADSGLAADTVVVYTSDHGELTGAHGLYGKGPCAYDANLRLPLVVVDPSRTGGVRAPQIASQLDLVPTLVGMVTGAVAPTPHLPGRDLLRSRERSGALFAYDGLIFLDGHWALRTRAGMRVDDQVSGRDLTRRGLMRTLVTATHTFSRYFAPGQHHRPGSMEELVGRNTLELFDRVNDPDQRTNLAFQPDQRTLALIEALNAELNAVIDNEIGEDDGRWLPRFPGAPWI